VQEAYGLNPCSRSRATPSLLPPRIILRRTRH